MKLKNNDVCFKRFSVKIFFFGPEAVLTNLTITNHMLQLSNINKLAFEHLTITRYLDQKEKGIFPDGESNPGRGGESAES